MLGRRPKNISATKTWRITALKRLNILTTGGTIDKIYYDDKSDYQIGEPEIARILKAMNVAFDWEIRALMRKDSLHLDRSEEHTSELQSRGHLVCRLLLEKKKSRVSQMEN